MASHPRVALLSLGCAKNLVDSERIASILQAHGVEVVHAADGARVTIVNTCGFIDAAKEESIDAILEAAEAGPEGQRRTLIVAGCLSERYGSELSESMPEVDAMVGIDPAGAARLALRAFGIPLRPGISSPRVRRLTPEAWSYLRISHGCDNRCAYCAIPLIRGPLRSRPPEELLEEAVGLAERGVRELNLIGQDTASYGTDTDGRPLLHELLPELCRIEGIEWVRVLYMHPAHVYRELIEVMAAEPAVCPYVDVPLQHAADGMLRRMGRRVDRRGIEALLRRLRGTIPGVALRTTFIVGFPGETEEEFEELLGFVREQRFDRLGCFAYSREEDTRAASMPGQVPPEVRQERRDRLMSAQQRIAFELAAERQGEHTTVLIEEGPERADGVLPARGRRAARSPREAPDVDPLIYVESGRKLRPGQFVEVEIVGAEGYDCIAVQAEEDAGEQV